MTRAISLSVDSVRAAFRSLILGVCAFGTLGLQTAAAQPQDIAELSIEELSRLVVTTVSRRPKSLGQVASAVQVIGSEDIRRSGAVRLPEALRRASNLQVAQISGDGWAISSRGFNSALANKLLVMIDGRTIYSPLFAGTFWEAHDVPLYDVERIEVISGPGGTLWGANAVNGIINVVTRSAQDTHGLYLSGAAGNELEGQGAIRYGTQLGADAHLRVYAQYLSSDGLQLANGDDALNDSNVGSAGFRLDWNVSERDALTVEGTAVESETQTPTPSDATSRSQSLMARWRRQVDTWGEVQLQTYFDRAHRRSPGAYGDQLDTFDIDFQHSFTARERHRIVWGINYRAIEDDFEAVTFAMNPAQTSLTRLSGFLQDEIALVTDKVNLTVGTKIEDNEYTGTEWQPSVRLGWQFQPRQLLWGAVSRAVRTPARVDRDLFNPASPPFTVGSGSFDSEKLLAYELGLKLQPVPQASIALATYFNEYDDVRSFEPPEAGPLPIPLTVANGLEGDGYGAELTAEYRVRPNWRVWAGYTYQDLELERKPDSREFFGGSIEARDWHHQVFVRAAGEWGGIEMDAALRRIGGIANQELGGYTELDMRVSWRPIASLEVALVGRNLLDDAHSEFGPVGRQEIERSAYLQLTWRP